MTAAKDSSVASRHPRPHSHSLSTGSISAVGRVSRRKSMTSTKPGFSPRTPSFGPSLPPTSAGSAIEEDGPHMEALVQELRTNNKAKMRRASEGSRLSKGESKRPSSTDLRCEKCGKAYKHSSCLTKHLWEHTPEWSYTSKLLISKHQQVQLLEAASVLVTMNQDGPEDPPSDHSSGSEYLTSSQTTPPYLTEAQAAQRITPSRRKSSMSSSYSRSNQSGASIFSESAPVPQFLSHYRQWSHDNRPPSSITSAGDGGYGDEDEADLAAAVGLLRCSSGTPKSGPSMLPSEVPPVPPLPAQYMGHQADADTGGEPTPRPSSHLPRRNTHTDDYEDNSGMFAMEE